MTVLVTGSGLIGSQISRILLEQGERPILYDVAPKHEFINDILDASKIKIIRGNILNPTELLYAVKDNDVDKIIHTVAIMTSGALDNPYDTAKTDIEGTLNILEVARIMDVERVVFTSSAWVFYGSLANLNEPIKEDFPLHFLNGRPPHVYATSKVAGEYLGFNYMDLYGLDFVAVRFAAAFGPWRGAATGLVASFFREIVDQLLGTGRAVINKLQLAWPEGMEFTYSKDAGRGAVLACLAEKPQNRVYNITMGRLYRLSEVLDILKKLIPSAQIEVKSLPTEGRVFIQRHPTDLTKAKEEIGYDPEYPMEEALSDYINFVKNLPK